MVNPSLRPVPTARAFALLDAVVGAVLLGLALAAVLGLSSQALSSQARGEQLATAARLADERLSLVLATGPEAYASVFPLTGPCDEPFGRFTYQLSISPQGGGNPYRVRAAIGWQAGGRPQTLAIETLIAPRLGDDPDPDRKPKEAFGRNAQ